MTVAVTTVKRAFASLAKRRTFSTFTFTGPRNLNDIVKKELLENKSSSEIADIWYTYHETKDHVHGLVLAGDQGKSVLSRAAQCPFFLQPIFRGEGFFHLLSQFQDQHFLFAYLADYQMDPARAQPLLTCSVFNDFNDITLVRADVVNHGIDDEEGRKVVSFLLDSYANDEEFKTVENFNKAPEKFDIDFYVEKQRKKWTNDPHDVNL